jgi:hypothetical protein
VDASRQPLENDPRWGLLYRRSQEVRALDVFAAFRAEGIEPILIKGWAVGRLYPTNRARVSTDMDLSVSANDFHAAERIAASLAPKGHAVDLHRELRHLDTLCWDDLFEHSRLVDVEGGNIRLLRPEDHLRVLIVHWLTNGGSDRDRLWDVYYSIANRPADFDWDRFLNVVDTNRRRWLTCTIGLAHRFLDLDLDETPVKNEALDIPAWLIRTVEREWNGSPLVPLESALQDREELLRQLPKRLQPNPIWATVQMEGSFDAATRVFYQIGSFFKRIMPSYRRVSSVLSTRQ